MENLKMYLGGIFQVLQGDGLPPYICQKCVSKLNIAFQFKAQCESSDAKLRQCFDNFHNLPPTPDFTGFIEHKKDYGNNFGNNLSLFTQNNDGDTETVDPAEIPINPQIHSTELDNGSILDANQTQILVQMESDTSLYNVEQKAVVNLKTELDGIKTNINMKVCIQPSRFFLYY